MATENPSDVLARMRAASQVAADRLKIPAVADHRLSDAIDSALDPQRLIDGAAEAWRTTPEQAKTILADHGFAGVLARLAPVDVSTTAADEIKGEPFGPSRTIELDAASVCRLRAFNPCLDEPATATAGVIESVEAGLNAFLATAARDPLGVLYRHQPAAYVEKFLAEDAARMDEYIRGAFGESGPRYLVNSGIGANEQFNYFVSALANNRPDRRVTWLLANSPKEIATLPAEATIDNTLFMEFSRSGITEETVKLHEFTPAAARRIVFANAGALRDLGQRDGNLVLSLPSEVSGRYGRNKTPILLAPMHVAGMDVRAYWRLIQTACDAWDLSNAASAPLVLARYLRVQQLRRGVNHIYLGTNDPLLRCSADEFCQFWNEGVNRDGNDITMSRYLGLPRDSHMNLEAILGTSEHKMAVFLLRTGEPAGHALLNAAADSIRPQHAGLSLGETDLILALANVKRCSEKMPTILITVDAPTLSASAVLGQLWADTTLVYSRLIGVDPGSNPEVKAVRTRAEGWLADKGQALSLLDV